MALPVRRAQTELTELSGRKVPPVLREPLVRLVLLAPLDPLARQAQTELMVQLDPKAPRVLLVPPVRLARRERTELTEV